MKNTLATTEKAARPNARRSRNTESILEILRLDGPSSQAHLARRTSLSAATVNTIVRELKEQGTIEIRPLNGREGIVALVTVTGTFIAVELSNDSISGTVYAFGSSKKFSLTIAESNPQALDRMLKSLAADASVKLEDVNGIAIAVEAPLEKSTHAIAKWCNLRMSGWAGVNFQDIAAQFGSATVIFDNDSNFAALAEWTWGAGRGVDDFLYVRSAGGVGGGIILNGSIYHGGNGMAGDLGHVVIEADGEVCYCGSRGCLTTLVSRKKILAAVSELPGRLDSMDKLLAAAQNGDAASQRVLAEAGEYLGRGLVNIAKVLAPSVIAIGGDLGRANEFVFESLKTSIEMSHALTNSDVTAIVPAEIGDTAPLLGGLAALLAAQGKGVSELPEWTLS